MSQMFFGNSRVMLFAPNGGSTPPEPANNGYDVRFVLNELPLNGEYSQDYIPSYWNGDANLDIWFSNGSRRQMQESDMGTTLHNVIGFSYIPTSSSWYWVDENSESIENHGHYWDSESDEPTDPYFKLDENITVYAIEC